MMTMEKRKKGRKIESHKKAFSDMPSGDALDLIYPRTHTGVAIHVLYF